MIDNGTNLNRDALLIEDTLNGNVESFSILVRCYQDQLYKFLYKMTLSREDTEDILQEVFIKAYNNLYRYNRKWSFSTWIYNIAVNVFKNQYRKKKKSHQYDTVTEKADELPCSIIDNPDVAYEIKEQKRLLVRLINELKGDQKMALILKHVQGFSYKEVGDILEISPEAAKMKVQRAKQTLCKKYEEMGERGVLNEVHI